MRYTTTIAALALAALVAVGCGGSSDATNAAPPADSSAPAAQAAGQKEITAPGVTPEIEAATRSIAGLGPHQQSTLPPLPFRGYDPPRPREVVAAAYQFAAEHPEVLAYIPCFCGCQQAGHRGNHECFVRSRAVNGDVIEWDEHGVECAVCIDVATRSRQMHASGASVTDIRAAIEREFASSSPTMTPTPKPPAAHSH